MPIERAARPLRTSPGFSTMKIIPMVKTRLVMTLLCLALTANAVEIRNPPYSTSKTCPNECICTAIEMLCPGANITDVLNFGIDDQILHLDFSNMALDYIPLTVHYCKKLNLSANNIQKIHELALQNLWNLEELILSNNSITDITEINPSVLFYNNKNIRLLNLSGNPLSDLGGAPDTIFYSESLEILDVSECQIVSLIGPMVLSGLKKLTYLNLSNNPLIRFDGIISSSLTILNLRGCLLNYFGMNALSGFKNLQILDAGQNEQLFMDYPIYSSSLKTLDVSQCSVRTPNLLGMTELQSAFLNGNQIRRLGANQFSNNTKLLHLDLSDNHINTVDPFTFCGMTSLRYLDLSKNSISEISWHSLIATLVSLEGLNLSHNNISRLGMLKSNSLRRLDLSYCQIQLVPSEAFTQLDQLTHLVLSNNPLQMLLPGSLRSTNLSILDLSYCRISRLLSYEFINSPNLSEIRLTGNRLVTFKNGTFSKCPKLKSVYLDDNPWRCDCYSADFAYMAWLANSTIKQPSFDRSMLPAATTPYCQSPDNVTNLPWHVACGNSSAYGHYGRDNNSRKNFSMAVGVILILCVSGLMAILVAVHENMKTRQALRRQRDMDHEYADAELGADLRAAYGDDYAAAESVRKLSQLPSYDEAVMLPKPSPSPSHRSRRAHSCTQTDEAEIAAIVSGSSWTKARQHPQHHHHHRHKQQQQHQQYHRHQHNREPNAALKAPLYDDATRPRDHRTRLPPPPPPPPGLHVTQL